MSTPVRDQPLPSPTTHASVDHPQVDALRRRLLAAGVLTPVLAALPASATKAATRLPPPTPRNNQMKSITTTDGAQIFYKDWGTGQPIVFHHGWPLSSDDWDTQMLFFLAQGYRVIAHDRRGHGRSTQTATGNDMDTYAADVAQLAKHLDLRDAIHIGHSTGGGEAARYVAQHGAGRVAKLVLIGAVPPLMMQTAASPDGVPKAVLDGLRKQYLANRAAFYWEFPIPFYGFNRSGATLSEAVRQNWWRQGMMGGAQPQYECITAFSETDFTQDLKRIDVPTLVMHGDDDQIVPIANSALLSAKLLKNATLKVYKGFPHGMCTTHADVINPDLLAYIRG
jgi:non-heme chloroperoxidase